MSDTLILVPMKAPSRSKTRLSADLADADRERLARGLFQRSLAFLEPVLAAGSCDLAVLTGSDEIARLAQNFARVGPQCHVIREPEGVGLNGALRHGAAWAVDHGYARLCIVPADLVAPAQRDMLRLLESSAQVTICPSANMGTNALMLSPPDAIDFCYGPRSAVQHSRAARGLGLSVVTLLLESLRFDLDTSACLQEAIRTVPDLKVLCG